MSNLINSLMKPPGIYILVVLALYMNVNEDKKQMVLGLLGVLILSQMINSNEGFAVNSPNGPRSYVTHEKGDSTQVTRLKDLLTSCWSKSSVYKQLCAQLSKDNALYRHKEKLDKEEKKKSKKGDEKNERDKSTEGI